jgi:hypothetical protein
MNVSAARPKSVASSNKPIILPRKKPQPPGKASSRASSDRPEILRAQLSHAIKAREPVDIVESIQLLPPVFTGFHKFITCIGYSILRHFRFTFHRIT